MKDFLNVGEVDKLKIYTLLDDLAGSDSPFLAQHGISLLLEITSGTTNTKILVDVGQNAQPVLHNMKLHGIQPSSIDIIFISHCHYDHTGGLIEIVKSVEKEVAIVAHPSMFRENVAFKPFLKHIGVPCNASKEAVIKNGGKPILVKEPFLLTSGVLSTGEVDRVTEFETQGIGTYNIENGKLTADKLLDDMSLVINVKDKGLFIVTGCSHSGIVNIIKHAVKITGINNLYGIIGGLHLKDAKEDRIHKTVAALKEFNPQLIVTGHCTGLKAQCKISQEFASKFSMLYSGKVIEI